MPSTYAHYRLGQQVRRLLPQEKQKVIEKYLPLYLIGLHGPDILFYYRPFYHNHVNTTGYDLHKHSGKEFFDRASQVIAEKEEKEPYIAYIYGVLNHFALDASAHDFVNAYKKENHVSHTEIEVEFDRSLLVYDFKDPLRWDIVAHLHSTKRNAEVIAEFYPGVSPIEVQTAIRDMVWYNHWLIAPGKWKRNLVNIVLKMTGDYEKVGGMLVNEKPNPDCVNSNKELARRYKIARDRAVEYISGFDAYCRKETYFDLFDYSFGAKKVEK